MVGGAIPPAPAVPASTRIPARLKRVGNTVHAGISSSALLSRLLNLAQIEDTEKVLHIQYDQMKGMNAGIEQIKRNNEQVELHD